jgi:hypothetical protein
MARFSQNSLMVAVRMYFASVFNNRRRREMVPLLYRAENQA